MSAAKPTHSKPPYIEVILLNYLYECGGVDSDSAPRIKATQAIQQLLIEAQLNLLEYFDQVPSNDVMDWKGLFADSRKLLKEELADLERDK